MDRATALVSIMGLRFAGAGLGLVLGPRWVRNMMADFLKMSDSELRIIGYVLLGAGVVIGAQQATRRALSDQLRELVKARAG